MSKRSFYQDNYAAIQEIINGNQRKPKHWNKEILKKFHGYGGLKEIYFDPQNNNQWSEATLPFRTEVQKLKDLIDENFPGSRGVEMIDSLKKSTLTSFYTPPQVIKAILSPLNKKLRDNSKLEILDPCVGTGRYIEEIKNTFAQQIPQ